MNQKIATKVMVRSALLGAASTVLMQFNIRLPIFPGFLQLDIGDLPAVVGAITTGPLTGFLTILIKNLLDPLIFGTTTGGIGNFANFVMGVSLVLPLGLIFKKYKSNKGYLLGSVVGLISLVISASIMNYFVLLPLFTRIFMPMETIIYIANEVNSSVTNVPTLILFAIVPFNLLKGTLVLAVGYIIFRTLRPMLKKL